MRRNDTMGRPLQSAEDLQSTTLTSSELEREECGQLFRCARADLEGLQRAARDLFEEMRLWARIRGDA